MANGSREEGASVLTLSMQQFVATLNEAAEAGESLSSNEYRAKATAQLVTATRIVGVGAAWKNAAFLVDLLAAYIDTSDSSFTKGNDNG